MFEGMLPLEISCVEMRWEGLPRMEMLCCNTVVSGRGREPLQENAEGKVDLEAFL